MAKIDRRFVGVKFDTPMFVALRQYACRHGLTLSEVVRRMVSAGLQQQG